MGVSVTFSGGALDGLGFANALGFESGRRYLVGSVGVEAIHNAGCVPSRAHHHYADEASSTWNPFSLTVSGNQNRLVWTLNAVGHNEGIVTTWAFFEARGGSSTSQAFSPGVTTAMP